mmetsp:Transcript_15371/g.31404  ORF Transcript_15371/g.31404 Transcript_15371/m.31404 type:complete len:95 (+) Transcript_15371:394-678(+)
MNPFVILTVGGGAPKVVPSRWFHFTEENAYDKEESLFDNDFQTPLPLLTCTNILWRPFLNNMFWNLNSFNAATSFAGETIWRRQEGLLAERVTH